MEYEEEFESYPALTNRRIRRYPRLRDLCDSPDVPARPRAVIIDVPLLSSSNMLTRSTPLAVVDLTNRVSLRPRLRSVRLIALTTGVRGSSVRSSPRRALVIANSVAPRGSRLRSSIRSTSSALPLITAVCTPSFCSHEGTEGMLSVSRGAFSEPHLASCCRTPVLPSTVSCTVRYCL